MDPLTCFGLAAILLMLVCYALEPRGRGYVLAFAGACVLAAIYAFLQGAWPFAVAEVAWSGVALRRWWTGGSGTVP